MIAPKLILPLLLCPSLCFAGNFATCILDKMPGVQNDPTALATYKACKDKYGGALESVEKGSGRGMFSYQSGAECASDKGAKTQSQAAGQMIYAACAKLYDRRTLKPEDFKQ